MSSSPFLFIALVITIWVIAIVRIRKMQRRFQELAREFGWDRADSSLLLLGVEGSWRGKAASIRRDRRGTITVAIEINAPSRIVVRRPRFLSFDLAGPPPIEVPFLRAFKVRATSRELALAYLADANLQHALEAAQDLGELRLGWRIEVTVWAGETLFNAVREDALVQAWNVARAAAERIETV